MRALLDVNVLLALLDSDHVDHGRARQWLEAEVARGWASCAITQNGFVRIVTQPRYPSPISVSRAVELLAHATRAEHHEFWSCDLSFLDDRVIDHGRIHGPRQVTDAYLLALARHQGGRFVTFDARVPIRAVEGAGSEHLVVI